MTAHTAAPLPATQDPGCSADEERAVADRLVMEYRRRFAPGFVRAVVHRWLRASDGSTPSAAEVQAVRKRLDDWWRRFVYPL